MNKEETMKDGTIAHLSESKRYYIRREPFPKWKRIKYYTLDGESIPLAKGKCMTCKKILESKCCGDFQSCECGSLVDTDRWFPERHRFGGNIKLLT